MRTFLVTFPVLAIFFFLVTTPNAFAQTPSSSDWYMAGANPKRTGWSSEEARIVSSQQNPQIEWYRKIEAYIDQKVQLIAVNNMIYVSTSKGLIALQHDTGQLAWQYNTQLPLGHSPTVDMTQNPPVVYVGGYDKKLYALNANNGQLIWAFEGARAGYNTNPLVVEGKVILGNRDGGLYAINAVGSPNAGQQAWRFNTDGPIMFSAAYKDGIAYIASNDQFAYAVRVSNGTQVWKSQELPGDGFHSYYPVIYRDKVIFSKTIIQDGPAYRGVFAPDATEGTMVGTVEGPTSWSNGYNTLHPWRVLEAHENNPDGHSYQHKPLDRPHIVLNQSNGQEFTFDSDGDGFAEYIPFSNWNDAGTQYPVVVDPQDNLAYSSAPISCCSDMKGKMYGWDIDNPSRLSIVGASSSVSNQTISQQGGWAAMAEPIAFSGGGSIIYENLCCNRRGAWFNTLSPQDSGQMWSYNLGVQIPDFTSLWTTSPVSISMHQGWYSGKYVTGTGTYHSHGDQAPLIPYNDRVYTHRANVIIAFGSGTPRGELPQIPAPVVTTTVAIPSESELRSRLNAEIQEIIDVDGHLRPGWITADLHNYGGDNRGGWEDYFTNPGETLYTLSYAYPYLTPTLQQQVANYLSQEFIPDFFDTNPTSSNPTMYTRIGYADGPAREWMDTPPDLFSRLSPQQKTTFSGFHTWPYPPYNFYALYLYAKNVPGVNVQRMYILARSKLRIPINVPVQNNPDGTVRIDETIAFTQDPFQHNAWITGLHGYLKLQELAGQQNDPLGKRQETTTEMNRLITRRNELFDKETAWVDLEAQTATNSKKTLDIARNFLFLSKELADDFRNNPQLFSKAQEALTMYEYIAPFWFAGKYEAMHGESVFQNLYIQPALFQAKAWILREPRQELYKYLDTPMFERGDLFYIQNLVATIEAPDDPNYTPVPATPTPVFSHGDVNGDGNVTIADLSILLANFGGTGKTRGQGDVSGNDGNVTIADLSTLLSNFGG